MNKDAGNSLMKSRAWLRVLPLSLDFMGKINQHGELTIFKRCSHRPRKGREQRGEQENECQIPNIPTATNNALK